MISAAVSTFFSVLHPSSIYPLSHAFLLQKCFNFFLAHPGPAVRHYNSGSGPQRVQTVLFQVCDICNVVARLHPLLIAVAIMASRVSVPAAGPAAPGLGCRATRAKCTETGQLSSWGLFLSRAAVRRHIAASKPCRAAKLQVGHGIREILVDVRTSDVMAGAGVGAGPHPTSNINQKVPCVGNVLSSVFRPCFMIIYHRRVHAGGVMVKATGCYA